MFEYRNGGIPIRVFNAKDGWLVVGGTSGSKGFAGLFRHVNITISNDYSTT